MRTVHKIGRFYTKIIMKNIGIFISVGLLSVVFHDHGWLPNRDVYAISQLIYGMVLPALIAYEGGHLISGTEGGVLAVITVSGLLLSESSVGILGAMLAGPIMGKLWQYEQRLLERRISAEFQLLAKNLAIGVSGSIFAVAGYYLCYPVFASVSEVVYRIMGLLISNRMAAFLSVVIEPAKVFFLNNILNHAVLVPLGMGQVQEAGSSVLFLLESNPGPGLGVLAALYYKHKEKRNEYAAAMIAQTIGGIHEVYFPFVLSDLLLLFPLILGGFAGNFCFLAMHAGLQGMVSPGSLVVITLMTGKDSLLPVLAGIAISAAVAFAGSFMVIKYRENRNKQEKRMNEEKKISMEEIDRVAFVCDGGIGSSAMGASIFRRMLSQEEATGVSVEAYAADMVPGEVNLIVCQKDFYEKMFPDELREKEVYQVENLLRKEEYEDLLKQIRQRKREV